MVLPVLGDEYQTVLDAGELTLALEDTGLAIRYHEHRFPVDPATYDTVAKACPEVRLRLLLERIAVRARRPGTGRAPERQLLRRASRADAQGRAALASLTRTFTGDRLDDLPGRQNYRLTHWRRAASEINYRRFFDGTGLVCLRIENPAVFAARHALLLRLVERGPSPACASITSTGSPTRGEDETLPRGWPADGTTGYDFLNRVTALQIDPAGARRLRDRAGRALGAGVTFESVAHDAKVCIARRHFIGEMRDMATRLRALEPVRSASLSSGVLSGEIIELTAAMPVYRTYAA